MVGHALHIVYRMIEASNSTCTKGQSV